MCLRGELTWYLNIDLIRSEQRFRPHIQMSQTRSPGAPEMPPCLPAQGAVGFWGKPWRAVIQPRLLSLKWDNKGEPTRGGKPSPPQQQQRSQGLYLTAVGIVGAAAQEHFQCTAKVDWDSDFLLRLQRERLAHFNSLDHPHTQQQNKEISIVWLNNGPLSKSQKLPFSHPRPAFDVEHANKQLYRRMVRASSVLL